MKRRDFLKTASLTALATSLYATSTRWNMAVAQDGTRIFTMAHPAGFPDLDPSTSFSNDGAIMANVYEGLTRYIPARGDAPARIEPLLAENGMCPKTA
jgi:peptide/nickel transport system substrate-binding protein